jgi:hypothetical protein
MLPTKSRFIWLSGFREDRLFISSRCIYKYGRHRQFLFLIGRYLKIVSFETAWSNELKLSRKRKQESPVVAMFVNGSEQNVQ